MTKRGLLDSLIVSPVPAVLDHGAVLLLLEDCWYTRRDEYWDRLFTTMGTGVSGLTRAVFAESLGHLALVDEDLAPLWREFRSEASEPQVQAYRFVCRFTSASPDLLKPLPWLRLCLEASRFPNDTDIQIAVKLLRRIIGRKDSEQNTRERAAFVAEALLSRCLEDNLSLDALQAVIDTADVDAAATTRLIVRVLDHRAHRDHEAALATLARQIDALLSVPLSRVVALAYEIAVSAEAANEFRYKMERRAWIEAALASKPHSKSIPGRPAHEGASYWLTHHIGKFVKAQPTYALTCFAYCAEYWERATDIESSPPPLVTLTVLEHPFRIFQRAFDGQHRYASKLIDHVLEAIVGAVVSAAPEQRTEMLRNLAERAAPASVWAPLIQASVTDMHLRLQLQSLITSPHAMRMFARPIVNLLIATGKELPTDFATGIVSAVASLHDVDDQPAKGRLVDALSKAGLGPDGISSPILASDDETRALVDADDAEESGEFAVAIGSPSNGDDDHVDMVTLGLPREVLNRPTNKVLRRLTKQAWDLIIALMPMRRDSERADPLMISQALSVVVELRAQLEGADAEPTIVSRAWAALARLASLLLVLSDDAGSAIVFEAARRTDGESVRGTDLLNASQVIPRAEAVNGLVWLAVRKGDEIAITEIERLSIDSEPAVRFQVASQLRELAALGRSHAWPLLERLVRDSNIKVAAEAIGELRVFYTIDQDAAIALCAEAFARFSDQSSADERGRTDALLQLAWYHLARAQPVATAAIARAVDEIPVRVDGINQLLHSFRGWLTPSSEEDASSDASERTVADAGELVAQQEPDDLERRARERTLALYKNIASACIHALRSSNGTHDVNALTRSDRSEQANLLEDVAAQIYFASGAFPNEDEGSAPLSGATIREFYASTSDLLVSIGTAGVVSAANRVLETLSHLLKVSVDANIAAGDILDRFVLVAESAVKAGAADRYWLLDSLEEVLRRCVAEREPSFREPRMVTAWARVLDPLLEAGWDQAFRLARELDLSQ